MEMAATTSPLTTAVVIFFAALILIVAVLRAKKRLLGLGLLCLATAVIGGFFAYQEASQAAAFAVALLFLLLALQNLRFALRK